MMKTIGGLWKRVARATALAWRGVREWCGDAAYERYLQSQSRHTYGATVLSREQFYLEQLQQRYSRVSRCC
jgi:uncharacterized short protein YbdD (DUF466 family)